MKSIFLSSIVAILLAACSYKSTTNSSAGEFGYLKFNTNGSVAVSINGGETFSTNGWAKLYRVKTGTNHVKVLKNGVLVYENDVYIGNQNTYEIDVR